MSANARSVPTLLWGAAIWVSALVLTQSILFSASPQTFRNPLFTSQDPHVIFWERNYYYSESDGDRIWIRKSSTLSGLSQARPRVVWTATRRGWDGHANLWAPEIHMLEGRAYIYFAADYLTDGRHLLYVLEGGTDPMGSYQPGDTGDPDGLLVESTGHWAIDPDVFYGPDQQLYLTWSCGDADMSALPQSLCIARMWDPLHVASATARIATPSEAWETRSGPVEEGPVGFVREGTTYLTYSASASWTTNDYTVGLLINASGNLLDPAAWVKRGPILDRHGKAYGPGSVILVPSPDGSEMWAVYHGYDRLNCAQWACRSIRMQKVKWNADGTPLLGYPVDPGLPQFLPSGDLNSPTGWGSSRMGAPEAGTWTSSCRSSAENTRGPGETGMNRIFRGGLDAFAFSISAEVREDESLRVDSESRYGIYALYYDDANYVEAFVDTARGVFGTRAVVGGEALPLESMPLPDGFRSGEAHSVGAEKSAARAFTFFLDGAHMGRRTIPLDFGEIGVFTDNTAASFRNVAVQDNSFGWGNASGDQAQGLLRGMAPKLGDGYVQGTWNIADHATVSNTRVGEGWNTIYQGNPNYSSYTVQAEVQWVESETGGEQRYGLIVCHDDRNRQVSLWIDLKRRELAVNSLIAGASAWRGNALPADFDPTVFHLLAARKAERTFTFLLDGIEMFRLELEIANGSVGVATEGTRANFRNFDSSYVPAR